jgi:hypothetical protein
MASLATREAKIKNSVSARRNYERMDYGQQDRPVLTLGKQGAPREASKPTKRLGWADYS